MQAGFRPAELKFKDHVSQWCKVEAVVSLDVECVLPPTSPEGGGEGREGEGGDEASLKLDQAHAQVCSAVGSITLSPSLIREGLERGNRQCPWPSGGCAVCRLRLVFAQAGVRVMLGRLQEAVVTLRGQVRQNSAPLLQQSSKKSKQSSPPETVQAALYLREVSVQFALHSCSTACP